MKSKQIKNRMVQKNLTELLSQLNVQSNNSEHVDAAKTCKELIDNGCSKEGEVFRQWLVALIKQDKYQTAFDLIKHYKDLDNRHGSEFVLEKLYVYYKLNSVHEFEQVYKTYSEHVTNKNQMERGILHIRAQFCYKNGINKEAHEIYEHLSESNKDEADDNSELLCNILVPLTADPKLSETWANLKHEITDMLSSEKSYDVLFNYSIILVALKEYELAFKVLDKAHELAVPEGYQNDLDTIELQKSYLLQITGQTAQSKELLKPLLDRLVPGSPLQLIANSNYHAFVDYSKFTTNFDLLLRQINQERFYSYHLQKYTHEQWKLINNNLLFLNLFNNNQINRKETILAKTLNNYKNLIDNVAIEPYKTQAKKLYHFTMQSIDSGINGSAIGNLLLTVQLLVVEKQYDNAIRICENFLSKSGYAEKSPKLFDQNHLVVCTILFQLYRMSSRIGNINRLVAILEMLPEEYINDNYSFWIYVAYEALANGNIEKSREILQRLSTDQTNITPEQNELINAVLSSSESAFDEAVRLVEDIDVEQIRSAGIRPIAPKSAEKSATSILRAQKKKLDIKKKKKRTARANKFLAKREVVKKNPDPERWLPLKDRSSYRVNKKQAGKTTQGGASSKKIEQALDITKKNTASKSGKGKAKPKKKGKGRK